MRLKIGVSQMASPTPWPYWSANADSSLGKPNSSAAGHSDTVARRSARFHRAIARSMYSRHRMYASRIAGRGAADGEQR